MKLVYQYMAIFLFFSLTHIKSSSSTRVVVSTAALRARARGSIPGLGGLKETKMFLPIHVWKSVLWGASVTER